MNTHQEKQKEYNYEFKKFVSQVLLQWHWVALFLIIGFTAAYLTVRYTSSIYIVSASFVTKKFDKSSINPLLQMSESRVLIQDDIRITQEIPLLKSQDRIQETLDRLNFNTSYFVAGRLKASEVYPTDFYKVNFDPESIVPYGIPFYLETINETSFSLRTENQKWQEIIKGKIFKFRDSIDIEGWKFTIGLQRSNGADPSNQHYFVINMS